MERLLQQSTAWPAPEASWQGRSSWPRAWLGVALAAAYLPHLILYAIILMRHEHYQFLPLAWLGAIALAWSRRAAMGSAGLDSIPVAAGAAVAVALALLGAAGLLNSAWLGAVSAVPMVLGLAAMAGGGRAARAVVPALLLYGTTLRLPGTLNDALILKLRAVAVGASSRVLDLIGVIHAPVGNVLRVPGSDLLVDEACSGVNSLVSLGAVVLFLGLWLRRPPVHLALVLAGSVGIVLLANVARMTVVTVAFTRWQVDLLHGWKHGALGLALYAVSTGLVASLDQLVSLLGSVPIRRPARSRSSAVGKPAGRTGLEASTLDPGLLAQRGPGRGARQGIFLIASLALVALLPPIRWARAVAARDVKRTEVASMVRQAQAALTEGGLPAELLGWRRVGFEVEERDIVSPFGRYSARWRYRRGDRTAMIGVDYPFEGWHELASCYQAIDWTDQRRTVRRGPLDTGSAEAASVAVEMENKNQEHASLRYALVDDQGRWLEPTADGGLGFTNRTLPWQSASLNLRTTCQVQLFAPGFRPQSGEERQKYTELFEAAARDLKRRLFVAEKTTP